MSYTPAILINKESFDKAFLKIKSKVEKYWENRRSFFSWYNEAIHNKCKEYESVVLECGSDINKKKINDKVEEEIKSSEEYKKKVNLYLREDNLASVFEYHDGKLDFKIDDKEYYYFDTDYSLQAKELIKFLEDNEVSFSPNH